MSKAAQAAVIVINCLWLAPLTGGVSLVVGLIGLIVVLGDR
jgi:hypothetical protein